MVITGILLAPTTVMTLLSGPVGVLGIEWLGFVWAFVAIGYFLGLWLCLEAEAKGLNGVTWGLLFAGPWWAFILVAYAFASYQRPTVRPPA